MNCTLNDDGADSILSENCALLANRFPGLAALTGLDSDEGRDYLSKKIPDDWKLLDTPAGCPTLSASGVYLHSRHNPLREAEKTLASASGGPEGLLFAGLGLGYLAEAYAQAHPDARIVVVEPDIFVLFLALKARPLAHLLNHQHLMLAVGLSPQDAYSLLEKTSALELKAVENPALMNPSRAWFAEFKEISLRNSRKNEINRNTLKKFGDLWLRNMVRNLRNLRDAEGIDSFKDVFRGMPALLVAAGPSLDSVLPRLPSLARSCVVIAVDTALRACLRAGVEPDFVLLVDPQYWNWRHFDGLSAPRSVLITESAAWPAVYRFPCRSIRLCSSLFPLGMFLETRTGRKGSLGAGGSVATTAFDFALHTGCSPVYTAGLDLGFPELKTHFKGSIFEERTHADSRRFNPAETAGIGALYGANPYPAPDYKGGTVLTDKRLSLYAWWFESKLAACPNIACKTLTPEGMKIPGFTTAPIDEAAGLPDRRDEIDVMLDACLADNTDGLNAETSDEKKRIALFDGAVQELLCDLEDMKSLTEKGISLCRKTIPADPAGLQKLLAELDELDRIIIQHPVKEVAAMVLESSPPRETAENSLALEDTAALYRAIQRAVEKNIRYLRTFY